MKFGEYLLRSLLPAVLAAAPSIVAAEGVASHYVDSDALTHYSAGCLLEARGRDADAMTEFSRTLQLDPGAAGAARHLSGIFSRLGEPERSLSYAGKAVALDSTDARALWLKGSALFTLGRGPEALTALEAATRADPAEADYVRTLARVAEQLDRIDEVARSWRTAVFLDEDDGEAWFQLAAAEARLGHFGAADSALTEALDRNPMRPGIIFLRGWIQESLGHPEAAVDLYRKHLRIHTDDLVTRQRLINLLITQRRYAEAYPEARAVSLARPDDLEALEVEADLALWTHHSKDAMGMLSRMRASAPDDPSATARAIGVLARHGEFRGASAAATEWSAAHPKDPRGPLLLAHARTLSGNPAGAVESTRRAVAMAPDSLAPRVLLGRLFQSRKQYAAAESVWVEAARRFPGNGGLTLDLAYSREQLGDLDGAEGAARGLVEREPRNASALNFLGYLLADHNRKLPEAESLVRRALEQEPDNGAYLDSMGWVYYRLGRFTDARLPLERAVGLTGGDPVVREHLGDVYKSLNLLGLAREQYQRCLAADSSNTRVRAKLGQTR
jgi:tetratricopeptide (TPR) repeat protein